MSHDSRSDPDPTEHIAAEAKATRPASADEIRRFKAGEQVVWRCPRCAHETEMLSALAVACELCRQNDRVLIWMQREPGDWVRSSLRRQVRQSDAALPAERCAIAQQTLGQDDDLAAA